MGRNHADSSPESGIEIKVHPRRSNPNSPSRHYYHRPSPPPRPYQPYKKWFPWFVPTIVVVNIVLFVIVMYVNNCPRTSNNCIGEEQLGRFAFQSFKQNPLLGPTPDTLQMMGALDVKKMVEDHETWRLASCMWLHAGVFHLLANMISLLFVGVRLEQEFGFLRIGLLYVFAGIGGSLLSSLFVRKGISVGASGALFGLLGAMLSELFTNWTIYENKMSALMILLLIIIINLAVGILPHVDNFAHFGGFMTGFLLGFILLIRPQYGYVSKRHLPSGYHGSPPSKSKYKAYQYVFLVLALLLLIAGFTIGLMLLLRGVDGNDYCSWCHVLSCVPTPLWSCTEPNNTCNASCQTHTLGMQANMTCMSSKHKSGSYILRDGNTTAILQQLCTQLCC